MLRQILSTVNRQLQENRKQFRDTNLSTERDHISFKVKFKLT